MSSHYCIIVYNRFGLSSVIRVRCRAENSPLLQCSLFLPPFLFSHRDHALKRFTDKFLFFLRDVLTAKRNKAGFPLWTRRIYITLQLNLFPHLPLAVLQLKALLGSFWLRCLSTYLPTLLSALPVILLAVISSLKIRRKRGKLATTDKSYFLCCKMSLCSLHSLIISL